MIFSLHLQLNSLIYSNHFSRYICGKLVSFPSSKPIARGEILILISTAPGWIQSVLKQLRTFVSARTKVDHVTRSLPLSDVNPRIVSRYRNQGTTCRFQRRPPFPSTHAKSPTYAMERRNDNWNLGQISVTCNRRRDYPNVYASNRIFEWFRVFIEN